MLSRSCFGSSSVDHQVIISRSALTTKRSHQSARSHIDWPMAFDRFAPRTMHLQQWRYAVQWWHGVWAYMTWPVPGSWENGMNFKQPTMSCQRPFGSRNRTNCRSIKAWKSLAVQTWTDLKDIESPYCSFPARVTILLRANVQSTGLFRRRHLIPKFLSNLSTASGYPKLSGDDPTNLLKHFEALY